MNTDPRTDSELNRIVSEWMGWRNLEPSGLLLPAHCLPWNGTPPGQIGGKKIHSPDYTNDLNACAEAERKLNVNQMSKYIEFLGEIGYKEGVCYTTRTMHTFCATARQRSEALVKVIEEERK